MKTAWNENMRLCRERYNYSQRELANKLNISERTIQRYEAGVSEPSISILLELSKLYEISIDSIIGNIHYSPTDPTRLEKYVREIENTCKTLRLAIYETENN